MSKETTASLRKRAAEAEAALAWTEAAELYRAPIAAYPNASGALAKLDIEKMTARAAACQRTADALPSF